MKLPCLWHHWHTLNGSEQRHQVATWRWYCRHAKLRWMITIHQRCCRCLTQREYTVLQSRYCAHDGDA